MNIIISAYFKYRSKNYSSEQYFFTTTHIVSYFNDKNLTYNGKLLQDKKVRIAYIIVYWKGVYERAGFKRDSKCIKLFSCFDKRSVRFLTVAEQQLIMLALRVLIISVLLPGVLLASFCDKAVYVAGKKKPQVSHEIIWKKLNLLNNI